MPRPLRPIADGLIYHVINRGNNRQPVFESEGDFQAFLKAIADLKENEISEPFKTRYGWHIVQMLGARTYDSTDDVRRQKAYAAIRESKADEETELWLRRLRDDAFVETKM